MADQTLKAYEMARELYARYGVDTEAAIVNTLKKPISLHCWQGDDVGGFENPGAALTGGIQATGNYPGKARTPAELRDDLAAALKCLPGETKLSLHASYLDTDKKVDRNEIEPAHFARWIDWANDMGLGLDFNQTFFSHPLSGEFSLSHQDKGIRDFWIEHAKRCRKIGEAFGKATGKTCMTNLWIHDGSKEVPIDRFSPRQRLMESLDEVFSFETDPRYNKDSVESKLFGIGSEAFVVGSHEFYLGYAMSRNKLYTLDAGHFHPTEIISAKFASVLMYLPEILLHVSRPVRWDSDHVVTMDDELMAIMQELVRGDVVDRVHIGLDYFDASINRIAAWVIGARNARKALLRAFLEPVELLSRLEAEGDNTSVLALTEELKSLPWGAVWDYLCEEQDVPVGKNWLDEVKAYEAEVTLGRG